MGTQGLNQGCIQGINQEQKVILNAFLVIFKEH